MRRCTSRWRVGEPKERVLAKDLKEERSRSLSASFDWYTTLGKGWQLNLMGEGFATWIRASSLQTTRMVSFDPKTGRKVITIINARDGMSKVYGLSFRGSFWRTSASSTCRAA